MLVARGRRSLGSARLAWALVFAPRVWSVVIERAGLVLDTRFVPAAHDPPRPRSCVYLLLRGSWAIHGERDLVGPCAFVMTEAQLEGADRRRSFTFAARGEPFQAIEIHVSDADLRARSASRPVVLDLDASVLDRAREVIEASSVDDAALERRFGALVGELARTRIVDERVAELALRPPAPPLSLLWAAIRPMVERMYLNPTLQELEASSGVSTRQLDRYVERFVDTFGLVGTRWRSSMLHLRLKLAVLMLSAEGVTVAEVARAVGYGSTDAMARSFRDAGVPPPGAVQEAVRVGGQ
jgi:AraC-like DNA-binding protein